MTAPISTATERLPFGMTTPLSTGKLSGEALTSYLSGLAVLQNVAASARYDLSTISPINHRHIFAHADIARATMSLDGRFLDVNAMMARTLGTTREYLLHGPAAFTVPPIPPMAVAAAMAGATNEDVAALLSKVSNDNKSSPQSLSPSASPSSVPIGSPMSNLSLTHPSSLGPTVRYMSALLTSRHNVQTIEKIFILPGSGRLLRGMVTVWLIRDSYGAPAALTGFLQPISYLEPHEVP
jgi:hypothetical protein